MLGQEHLERIFARSVGHRHRFKIDHRLIYGAASSRTVNLPAPLFGRIGSVLNDRGIVVWLKIDGHAEQYALSSHQRLVAVRWALYRNRLVISPLGRLPQAARWQPVWMAYRLVLPATRPPPLETAHDIASRWQPQCWRGLALS